MPTLMHVHTHTHASQTIIQHLQSTSCPAIKLNEGTHHAHTICCAAVKSLSLSMMINPFLPILCGLSIYVIADNPLPSGVSHYCHPILQNALFLVSNWWNIKKFVYCTIPYIITLEDIRVAYMKKYHYYSEPIRLRRQKAMALVCRTPPLLTDKERIQMYHHTQTTY